LDISSSASKAEIKKKFYELAKKYHPDSTEGQSASIKKAYEEKFKNISIAYEILSDDTRKALYDRERFERSQENN
jgi:DnaJ-class molecular chaperone